MDERTTQERWEKLILHRDLIIQEANLKGADIPLNSSFPEIIAGIARITIGLDTVAVETLLDSILGEVVTGDYTVKGQAIEDAKEAIRQAIIAKEVEVPSETPLSQFPAKIAEIEQGSCGTIPVHFFDSATGKEIITVYVNSGDDATPPPAPSHEHLTFHSWKGDYQNVTAESWVGTVYTTDEDATFIYISINSATFLSPELKLWKSATSDELVVDWGDGSTSSETASGDLTLPHTYGALGDYCIKISCVAEYRLNVTNYAVIYTGSDRYNNYLITKIYLPPTAKFNSSSLSGCRVMKVAVFSHGITALSNYLLSNCGIRYLVLPDTISSIPASLLNYCKVIEVILLPNGITLAPPLAYGSSNPLRHIKIPETATIVGGIFRYAACIERIKFPNSMTTLSGTVSDCPLLETVEFMEDFSSCSLSDVFQNNPSLTTVIFRRVTPPSIGSSFFQGMSQIVKVYVPDASVSAYKTATNWVAIADQIKPLSTRPAI